MKEFDKWLKESERKTVGFLTQRSCWENGAKTGWKAALEWTRKKLEKNLDEIDKITGETSYWPATFIDLELMEVKTKEEVSKELREKICKNWGMPSWCGIPVREFSKEEIIQILNYVYYDVVNLEYPNKSETDN
jgi:hypothetical protein